MGKTADLTVAQKTIIDPLHKEGKPQTFIAKKATTGGGWEDPPPPLMIVKRFGCTAIHNKSAI